MNLSEEAIDEIGAVASHMRIAADRILTLRNDLFGYMTSDVSPSSIQDSYDIYIRSVLSYLNRKEDLSHVPSTAVDERKKYSASLADFTKNSYVPVYSAHETLPSVASIAAKALDHIYGPIAAHDMLKGIVDDENGPTTKKLTAARNVFQYVTTFENNRLEREKSLIFYGRRSREPADKICGFGVTPEGGPMPLIYNLNDLFLQPKYQLIGMPAEKVETFKSSLAEELHKLRVLKRRINSKLRANILITRPEFIDRMIKGIKPVEPYDLISGHPFSITARNMIDADDTLEKRHDQLMELYMDIMPGKQCGQSITFDVIYDVIFGPPEIRLHYISSVYSSLGFAPIPIISKMHVNDLVSPKTQMSDIIPKILDFDVATKENTSGAKQFWA